MSGWTDYRQQLARQLAAGTARAPWPQADTGAWLLALAAGAGLCGLVLWLVGGYHSAFVLLNQWFATLPDEGWQWLTSLGNERVVFACALLLALRYPRIAWALLLGGLLAALYARGLKGYADALRPAAVLAADDLHIIGPTLKKASFPSGHSTVIALLCGVLLGFMRWRLTRALLVGLAVLVGCSRIAVGAHWPIDVCAGLAGGTLAAWLGLRWSAAWSTPAGRPAVHLFIVALALLPTVTLLFDHGGYPAAGPALQLFAALVLLRVAADYLIGPLIARLREGSG